jgi:hypothetical protein
VNENRELDRVRDVITVARLGIRKRLGRIKTKSQWFAALARDGTRALLLLLNDSGRSRGQVGVSIDKSYAGIVYSKLFVEVVLVGTSKQFFSVMMCRFTL